MAALIDLFFDAFLLILGIGVFGGIIMGIGAVIMAAWNALNK
jgi:hypothetical protein